MSTDRFIVAPDIFDRFPGMRIAVAVAHGLDNSAPHPVVTAAWHEAWRQASQLTADHPNAQSHPRVQPWRVRIRSLGISAKEFPSSIEAVLRRAMRGGEPFAINPLVDFYNTVSLRHIVPAGGFDLDHISGPLELRFTHEGDRFTALDESAPLAVSPGEVAYTDGPTVLTRHFVWRQSREALITPATRSAILISEILGDLEPDLPEAVLGDLADGLRTYFGASPQSFLVDKQTPAISWE